MYFLLKYFWKKNKIWTYSWYSKK